MERTCSNCGAVTPPEARFCRHCGTPLKVGSTYGTNEVVSPLAQTVPLSSEGLTTSSLGTDEGAAADTKRVARAEMEHLLRRSRFEAAGEGKRDNDGSTNVISDYAAPPTGELTEKPQTPAAPASAVAHPHATGRAQAGNRARRLWPQVAVMLVLALSAAALLAYYFLRQSKPLNVADLKNEVNSNQASESVDTNNAVEQAGASEVGPSPEETPQPSPSPSASVEPPRVERANQGQRESATATPTPAGVAAQPAPTPTPIAQATPAQTTTQQQPTAPATINSNQSSTQRSQPNADDFYFQAVNLLNGRDPRSLPRAELLRALQLFQNVKSGPHAAEARRQAARLGRALDRLNRQPQR